MTNKDIGLVVATKTEALWIEVRDNVKETIRGLERDLIVKKEMLKVAEKIIKREHAH